MLAFDQGVDDGLVWAVEATRVDVDIEPAIASPDGQGHPRAASGELTLSTRA